jgi:RNA polymerase sigma factor (sigma-70 family)
VNESEYRRLSSKIKSICRDFRFLTEQDVEDVVHDLLMKWTVEQRNPNQKIKHAIIDWIRAAYGRTDTIWRSKMNSLYLKPIDDRTMGVKDDCSDHDYHKLKDGLNERYSKVVDLKYIYGCTTNEIAKVTGATYATINQILFVSKKRIKKNVDKICL